MDTKIYKKEQINEAAAQLKAGQLVAFPTETVFGLGAIATNEAAVSIDVCVSIGNVQI